MRFVRGPTLAGELRGAHIAAALGVPCDDEYKEPSEWVVFVKQFKGIKEAKADGCLVAFDPVDFYCYPNRPFPVVPEVDLLIVPNKKCAHTYKALFPRADFLIVPHQWDSRITGEATQDEFRPGYVGREFNLDEHLHVPMVTERDEQLAALAKFNCHLAAGADSLRKPATKVSSAAAVGANIITRRTASALELLGEDYPFFADGTLFDALYQARKAFGGEEWKRGLETMARVRERTSLGAVSDLYRVFL